MASWTRQPAVHTTQHATRATTTSPTHVGGDLQRPLGTAFRSVCAITAWALEWLAGPDTPLSYTPDMSIRQRSPGYSPACTKRVNTQASPNWQGDERSTANTNAGAFLARFTAPPARKTGRWTKEEDQRLRAAVASAGVGEWERISSDFLHGTRDSAQCLQRWQKVLQPGFVKGPWTTDEDRMPVRARAA